MGRATTYISREKFSADNAEGLLRKQFASDGVDRVAEKDAKELGAGTLDRVRRFVISTGNPDRDNDTVSVNGWKLEAYRKNPVVLWAHDYSALPVARCLQVGNEGDRLVAIAEFATHPFADTVLGLIDGGFLRATSVGFRPLKYVLNEDRRGYDFTEQELLEFSVVPVPANSEALIEARSAGMDLAPLEAWAKGVVKALEPEDARERKRLKAAGLLETVLGHCQACDKDFDGPSVVDATDGLKVKCLACAGGAKKGVLDMEITISDALGEALKELPAQIESAVKAALPSNEVVTAEKRGRVLSRTNEGKLRAAKDQIDAVLAQLEQAQEVDDEGQPVDDKAAEPAKKDTASGLCCHSGCSNEGTALCAADRCGHMSCSEHSQDGNCSAHCLGKSAQAADDVVLTLSGGDDDEDDDDEDDDDEDDDDDVLELAEDDAVVALSADDARSVIADTVKELVATAQASAREAIKDAVALALRQRMGRVD